MGHHPTRDLLRQPFADELARDTQDDEVRGHVEQGCMTSLLTLRKPTHTAPEPFGNLMQFSHPVVSAEERLERFGPAFPQTLCRALTVEGERCLGPTLPSWWRWRW